MYLQHRHILRASLFPYFGEYFIQLLSSNDVIIIMLMGGFSAIGPITYVLIGHFAAFGLTTE